MLVDKKLWDGKENLEEYKKLLNEKFIISTKQMETIDEQEHERNKEELLEILDIVIKESESRNSLIIEQAIKSKEHDVKIESAYMIFVFFRKLISKYYDYIKHPSIYKAAIDFGNIGKSDDEYSNEIHLFDLYSLLYRTKTNDLSSLFIILKQDIDFALMKNHLKTNILILESIYNSTSKEFEIEIQKQKKYIESLNTDFSEDLKKKIEDDIKKIVQRQKARKRKTTILDRDYVRKLIIYRDEKLAINSSLKPTPIIEKFVTSNPQYSKSNILNHFKKYKSIVIDFYNLKNDIKPLQAFMRLKHVDFDDYWRRVLKR